uniref:Uncharacterized protein n=1 Tax=Timema genevievae TaxID=629358 RepID=A0A7R9JV94_TIMGE|nr:unnamed protein product [Timema genevievae]
MASGSLQKAVLYACQGMVTMSIKTCFHDSGHAVRGVRLTKDWITRDGEIRNIEKRGASLSTKEHNNFISTPKKKLCLLKAQKLLVLFEINVAPLFGLTNFRPNRGKDQNCALSFGDAVCGTGIRYSLLPRSAMSCNLNIIGMRLKPEFHHTTVPCITAKSPGNRKGLRQLEHKTGKYRKKGYDNCSTLWGTGVYHDNRGSAIQTRSGVMSILDPFDSTGALESASAA